MLNDIEYRKHDTVSIKKFNENYGMLLNFVSIKKCNDRYWIILRVYA
jgi:hypothetical protein